MFVISCKRNNKYGVTDTKDGVVEFYTKNELFSFSKQGIIIEGLSNESISVLTLKENVISVRFTSHNDLEYVIFLKSLGTDVNKITSKDIVSRMKKELKKVPNPEDYYSSYDYGEKYYNYKEALELACSKMFDNTDVSYSIYKY